MREKAYIPLGILLVEGNKNGFANCKLHIYNIFVIHNIFSVLKKILRR